jgi:DNA-binding IscR family transcriptional regulator
VLVTRKTDYEVRCILYLALAAEQVANVTEVSRQMHIPQTFPCKAIPEIEESAPRGLDPRDERGGFRLTMSSGNISLLDITATIQGPLGINCLRRY